MSQDDTFVGEEILRQLGGISRLQFMIGLKSVDTTGNSLTIRFRARAWQGINCCKVTLLPSDTYKVEFIRIRDYQPTIVNEQVDVYNDGLKGLFEAVTGLYLSTK